MPTKKKKRERERKKRFQTFIHFIQSLELIFVDERISFRKERIENDDVSKTNKKSKNKYFFRINLTFEFKS